MLKIHVFREHGRGILKKSKFYTFLDANLIKNGLVFSAKYGKIYTITTVIKSLSLYKHTEQLVVQYVYLTSQRPAAGCFMYIKYNLEPKLMAHVYQMS
jgi:hypothetical protein